MAFIRGAAHWRWPNGVIPYEFDDAIALSDPIRQTVFKAAVDFWHQGTPVRFVVRNNEADYIHVKRVPFKERCSMHVGRKGGMQVLECAGNPEVARVAHELGHAIGLFPDGSPIAALTKNADHMESWVVDENGVVRGAPCVADLVLAFRPELPAASPSARRWRRSAVNRITWKCGAWAPISRRRPRSASKGSTARGSTAAGSRLPGHLTGLGRTRRLVGAVGGGTFKAVYN
jgi:hypothetical protein